MNIDFLKGSSNSALKSYFDNICSLSCMSVVQNPTIVTFSSATVIDHLYTNDIQSNYKCSILLNDTSDNFPLLFNISCVTQKQENTYLMLRNMSKFVANEFIEDLNDEYLKIFTVSNALPEIAFYEFINIFKTTIDKHASLQKATRKIKRLRKKNRLTKAILIATKTKNKVLVESKKHPMTLNCAYFIKKIPKQINTYH